MASSAALLGLTFLIIGESHLSLKEYLINPLQEGMLKQGAAVHSIGACGASPAEWLKENPAPCGAERIGSNPGVFKGRDASTKAIDELIKTDKPDVVVVVMGDTLGSYDKPVFPKLWAWQAITTFTKAIAATNSKAVLVWVGPAWGQDGGKYGKTEAGVKVASQFLAQNTRPFIYIDSLKLSKPGEWKTLDGQHFTPSGYQAWADSITTAIVNLPEIKKLEKK